MTLEDRSVTVLVPDADGLYVDVVPARNSGTVWEFPTDDGNWIDTNPVVMTEHLAGAGHVPKKSRKGLLSGYVTDIGHVNTPPSTGRT